MSVPPFLCLYFLLTFFSTSLFLLFLKVSCCWQLLPFLSAPTALLAAKQLLKKCQESENTLWGEWMCHAPIRLRLGAQISARTRPEFERIVTEPDPNAQIRTEPDAVNVRWSIEFVLPCHAIVTMVTACLFVAARLNSQSSCCHISSEPPAFYILHNLLLRYYLQWRLNLIHPLAPMSRGAAVYNQCQTSHDKHVTSAMVLGAACSWELKLLNQSWLW